MRFVIRDPKKGSSGSAFLPPARCGPLTQDVVGLSADAATRCCVSPLPRDPAQQQKTVLHLLPDRGTLPETSELKKSRITAKSPSSNLTAWLYGCLLSA